MCLKGRCLVSFALIVSLIQSVVWITLSIVSALVHLCVLPVPPFESNSDFFLVTTVKLYFEGPECIPDGSYLGQFNDDYRNPDVLKLLTPEKVFAFVVALFILNVAYFILSLKCWLKRAPKSAVEAEWQNELLMGWSALTLVICAVDAVFSAKLALDFSSLKDYMSDPSHDVIHSSARGNLVAEVPYIPLVLALVSSRFVSVWLWNLVIGLLFFFNTLCCRQLIKSPAKIDTHHGVKQRSHVVEKAAAGDTAHRSTSMTLANGSDSSDYDIGSLTDVTEAKRSMEAVTRFSSSAPKTIYPKENLHKWSYWTSPRPNTSKDSWEITNEGYVDDEKAVVEPEAERSPDFDHDLKNFEQGQRKIRIMKPPVGKPVEKMRE